MWLLLTLAGLAAVTYALYELIWKPAADKADELEQEAVAIETKVQTEIKSTLAEIKAKL